MLKCYFKKSRDNHDCLYGLKSLELILTREMGLSLEKKNSEVSNNYEG